ncbi:hypothetical protein ALC57_10845 [Trachymyrmex cornetzi]|uniref:Uncharacterized protein n=1 Tax=Trachymyrmex cornetzi TaxID=471704 RepID=A0A195DVJ4_9HYME|nr:hypothetical protein ALC57_10845 [Trachymyrmex cornetzi]
MDSRVGSCKWHLKIAYGYERDSRVVPALRSGLAQHGANAARFARMEGPVDFNCIHEYQAVKIIIFLGLTATFPPITARTNNKGEKRDRHVNTFYFHALCWRQAFVLLSAKFHSERSIPSLHVSESKNGDLDQEDEGIEKRGRWCLGAVVRRNKWFSREPTRRATTPETGGSYPANERANERTSKEIRKNSRGHGREAYPGHLSRGELFPGTKAEQ